MKDQPNIDTMINSYATGMLTAALNHNAAVIQLAGELVATGQIKPTGLKRVRQAFDKIHKDYQTEAERISGILEQELKSRGVTL